AKKIDRGKEAGLGREDGADIECYEDICELVADRDSRRGPIVAPR
ncbi:MAG: hypothetical protein QOG83_3141, partial [Alphaproteobacteria bacterium]|nr:hypothetical protein [Alphaproteobacteria bacterium]